MVEISHKEPRKLSLRAHIVTQDVFCDFLTPRKNKIENLIFSRLLSQKSKNGSMLIAIIQNLDLLRHENTNKKSSDS